MIIPKQSLVPASKYKIKCPYAMEAQFYVVHNTANSASAKNEIAYMTTNNNEVSYHYAIDDVEVIQGIPENRNAWAAGDGANGAGNRKGIHIEICYSKIGGAKYVKAEELAVKFIAQELHKKRWGIDKVKKHQDFSGKYCPHRILDEKRWDSFLKRIDTALKKLNTETKNMSNSHNVVVSKPIYAVLIDGKQIGAFSNHENISKIILENLKKNPKSIEIKKK